MTSIRARIFAALVAALGLASISPAFAGGPQHHQRFGDGKGQTLEFRRDAGGGAFRFTDLSCAPRAADRLDNRLERMASRLELTADQKKLFEDFRTTALTAQTEFSDQCDTLRPARSADRTERPDLIQRLEQRLKYDEARLAAATGLLPHFKAFYESLTDGQKSGLMQRKGFRPGLDAPRPGERLHRQAPQAPATPGSSG